MEICPYCKKPVIHNSFRKTRVVKVWYMVCDAQNSLEYEFHKECFEALIANLMGRNKV